MNRRRGSTAAPACPRLASGPGWPDNEGAAAKNAERIMKPTKLSEKEIAGELQKLHGWAIKDGALHRTFEFADFSEAFGFMARVALAAEAMNHHPDWSNVWNKVVVNLSTHSIGGLSNFDFELAAKMQKLAGK
jgi:4a-hydroxytetrahydrobiopterin dehydratase